MRRAVLERTDEIGVMRAMGMTRPATVLLFVGEAIAIALIGGGVGAGLGALPALWLEKNGITISEEITANFEGLAFEQTMTADLTPEILIYSFALGVVMAVIGSLLPALRAASIQPVTAMRTGR